MSRRGRPKQDDVPTEFTEGYYDNTVLTKYDPVLDKQVPDRDMQNVLSDEPVWPKYWRRNIPKVVQATLVFGLVHLGWTVKDYIINAIEQGGFELICVWGCQGSGKSNRLLQILNWVHGDWDLVLERIEYTPRGFISRLKNLPKGQRFPIMGWDDVTVHMSSSSFKLDPAVYAGIDSALAAIRTKCNVLVLTTPHIERLPANIRANITLEIYLGRNQTMLSERICKLPSYYQLTGFLAKVQIEPIKRFNIFDVPYEVYTKYEDGRVALATDAIDNLDSMVNRSTFTEENWVPMIDGASMAGVSVNTMIKYAKDKAVRSGEFDNVKYIWRKDIEKLTGMG